MFAQICFFKEWNSWAVTRFDDKGFRVGEEAEWYAHKRDAIASADDLLIEGEINHYEVFTREGSMQRTRTRKGTTDHAALTNALTT